MSDMIPLDAVTQLIEHKQRELCPAGMFSRNAVYGADREAFDKQQEILDAIEQLPTVHIVHCQDCKYAHLTYDGECKYCDQISVFDDEGDPVAAYFPPGWFCAAGEERPKGK